ncbi:hypothetical protein GCM10007079_46380 [Nocardiopsis terrae]|uniref:Transglycosylase SLT domain-containing protein n=1 Tax=Nocardiopsis terrae TaxID=372655 RepID=A0ABR9HKK7_9ACTN|nr:hypothetical protein [Nocardiopsis terrae]MBE1459554.1 hypothetical protein [Nocardiopsis terrae]GHC95095.1 hypothetical protein GCM10007079_46380 [Nocardiopsis terrae]
MTTPHSPELGDPRRPSPNRPPNRTDERGRPPRIAIRRGVGSALRWLRPESANQRDRGAGFVETAAAAILAALIITTVYTSEVSSTFNEGVRQMVCLVNGPGCGEETWVDHDRPEEPEEYEWGTGDDANLSDNKNLGMQAASAAPYNWTDQEWTCLDNLWSQQSAWDHNVLDQQTGARGIVGFNPALHGEMPAGFRDSASTQIDWGLDYIQQAYGTPCEAWDYWQSTRTY